MAECERVEAVARKRPTQVAMVDFVRRFDPSYAQAKADIDAGAIGRPFLVARDVDNGMAIVEFEGGGRAVFYASRTMAHGHETTTEVIGTAGSINVGVGAARDRIVTRDAGGVRHRAVTDFFERFGEAFEREMGAFVAACRGAPPPLTLHDATEATRIGQAITRSMKSGQAEEV